MSFAICVNCGNGKSRPVDTCGKCKFKPQSPEEKAKSLILSSAYEINGEYRGRTIEELKVIGNNIQSTGRYEFDSSEVQAVIEYAHEVMAITPRRLFIDGFKWIAPPIAILVIVYLVLFMTR
jgi:hypothetical protein